MLKWALVICAFSIEACAGFFSVYGLMKLFSGQSIAAGAMGLFLEIGKVVGAMHVYKNWRLLNLTSKIYMPIAIALMVGITSIGVYGFLTNAFQEPLHKIKNYQLEEDFLKKRIDRINNLIDEQKFKIDEVKKERNLLREKNFADKSDRKELLNRSFMDGKDSKWVNYSALKNYQKSIESLDATFRSEEERLIRKEAEIEQKINFLEREKDSLANRLSDLELEFSKIGIDIGPIKFMAETFEKKPEEIVNFLILILIFIFDPFALTLLASFSNLNARVANGLDANKSETIIERIENIEKKMKNEDENDIKLAKSLLEGVERLFEDGKTSIKEILETIEKMEKRTSERLDKIEIDLSDAIESFKKEMLSAEAMEREDMESFRWKLLQELKNWVVETGGDENKIKEKEKEIVLAFEKKIADFMMSLEESLKRHLDEVGKKEKKEDDLNGDKLKAMLTDLEKIKTTLENVNLISYQCRENANSNSDEIRQLRNKIEKISQDFQATQENASAEDRARFEALMVKIGEISNRLERLKQETSHKNLAEEANKMKLSQEAIELLKKFLDENERQKNFYHGNQISIKPR